MTGLTHRGTLNCNLVGPCCVVKPAPMGWDQQTIWSACLKTDAAGLTSQRDTVTLVEYQHVAGALSALWRRLRENAHPAHNK